MKKEEQMQSSPWYYKGQVVTVDSVPERTVGMVYKIIKYKEERDERWDYREIYTHSRGHGPIPDSMKKIYIGKKLLNSTTKKKIGVRAQAKQLQEMEKVDKRRIKKVTRVIKSSNWLSYNSSCKPLQAEIEEQPKLFRKEILHWCYSKKQMGYLEENEMHKNNVLEVDSYNDSIAGKYYRRDLIKPTI